VPGEMVELAQHPDRGRVYRAGADSG